MATAPVQQAVKGCYIAHYEADWLVNVSTCDECGYDSESPDLSIDPSDYLLSVINPSNKTRTYYISIGNVVVNDSGKAFEQGTNKDNGKAKSFTTFVLVLRPGQVFDVGYIKIPKRGQPDIYSHISDLDECASTEEFNPKHVYGFPLSGVGPFLCTQGNNGSFTHFTPNTYHAVDFRCPVGTPVLAVGDGEVISVEDKNNNSGVHAKNLFSWNSLMVKLDDGVFVEYVHIQTKSAIVKVGDRVTKGQVICNSGDVGFCPEPHLHLQMHLSDDAKAPTIKFALQDNQGNTVFPEVGKSYSGRVGQ